MLAVFPEALDPDLVGSYPASVKAGGGLVWDAVLEYRVWCYPREGAPDEFQGSDYFYSFACCREALDFAAQVAGAQAPLVLVLQEEFIDEAEPGTYVHRRERRMTEWPIAFFSRPRRTADTIPNFFASDAPASRLDIVRGLAV
ncbi:GCN5 family acetyltransferase [Pseudomarimonas arenosa]|uniref:GCN5 family acetyltransferase n=1 Tax=Pseudomarimonas arenosa TaxID=2774145 RepID=A0AAW3ZRH8_9GAMM|nr:GCN5 family acetyltransferase [Pseudomarimonas arenosa]MBD8528308.1 GCN5 family acetyltransferase [Pseudomarimonas arenosa]